VHHHICKKRVESVKREAVEALLFCENEKNLLISIRKKRVNNEKMGEISLIYSVFNLILNGEK
jgi:hypothetical protein